MRICWATMVHHEGMPLRAGQERLLSGPDHLHRAPRPPHQKCDVSLDGHVLLAAEPPAHVGPDDPNAILRNAEDVGDLASVLDDLRGHADGHHSVRVHPPHAGLGLEVCVVDALGSVGLLDHHRRRPKRRFGVAAAYRPFDQRVPAPVDRRRPRGQRFLGPEHAGELLVVDDHELSRLFRSLGRFRGHEGYRLPVVSNAIVCQDGHGDRRHAETARLLHDGVVRHVHRRHDRQDAGQAPCLVRVDRKDLRGWDLGSNDPCVQHPGELPVVRVEKRSLHLLEELPVDQGPADDVEVGAGPRLRPLVVSNRRGHQTAPCSVACCATDAAPDAYASMASTILV
jgi:hypothetical protein